MKNYIYQKLVPKKQDFGCHRFVKQLTGALMLPLITMSTSLIGIIFGFFVEKSLFGHFIASFGVTCFFFIHTWIRPGIYSFYTSFTRIRGLHIISFHVPNRKGFLALEYEFEFIKHSYEEWHKLYLFTNRGAKAVN